MSRDPENEYFSDGLAEELLSALAKLEGLRVVARTSSFRFRGRDLDIRDVGKQLNVSSVLEGSVRKAGNRLRITAQLINVADGYHLWSERYDREMEHIFAIQDEITESIVEKLKVKLLGKKKQKLVKRYTDNLDAYNLYLKGRYYLDRMNEHDIAQGIKYLEQAIEEDPNLAPAYAALADAYVVLGRMAINARRPRELLPKAKAAAEKALQIDELLPEAHASLGFVKFHFDWDWSGAEKAFKRSLEINPGYTDGYLRYGWMLMFKGDHENAATYIKRALALDPLSPLVNAIMGWQFYFNVRQYDRTIEHFQGMLEMNPNFWVSYFGMGVCYAFKGMFEEAFRAFEKALSFSGRNDEVLGALGWAYGMARKKGEARKILTELKELSKKRYVTPFAIALVYLGLDDKKQTLDWMEKGVEERSGDSVSFNVNPVWDGVRSEPRFVALVKKVGLEP